MPDLKNTDIELSDKEYKKAMEHVNRTIDLLGMELQTSQIPIGMFMVGMARFMGHAIREATSVLGPERRDEQIEAFIKIIKLHATDVGESDETKKEE